ncbi:MAG: VOC family protein [Candidatus Babeliales bacterium]|nr:VOC family protein [Candidatus Babeliales bacterium]
MTNSPFKIGMLILMQNDLEKAVEFYKKLGFVLKFHIKEKWAEFVIDQVKLGLCPTEHPAFERHTGIVLEVEDLAAVEENLKKHEIAFLAEPLEAVHGIMASIKDPSGNVIDIYQATPEKVQELAKKVAQETAKGRSCSDKEVSGDDDCSKSDACC